MTKFKSFSAAMKHELGEKGYESEKEEGHGELKGHPSIKAIANKHKIPVAQVVSQIKKGYVLEKEHTNNIDMAIDIAIQHVNEIPDYYDRLVKMEKQAKSVSEEKKQGLWANIHAKRKRGERPAKPGEKGYPKTLDIDEDLQQAKKNVGASKCWKGKKVGNPPTKMKGGREVPNCVPVNEDQEYSMVRSELATVINAARRLQKKFGKGEGDIEAWIQSKITKAADYLDTVADYADSGEMQEDANWDGTDDMDQSMMHHPTRSVHVDFEKRYCPQCKKVELRSECKYGPRYWDMFSLPEKLKEETKCPKCSGKSCKCETPEPEEYNPRQMKEIGEAVKLDPSFGNIISVIISWRGKNYMNKMFFPQVKMPTRREVIDQIQKVYPGASVLSYNISGLEPGQPLIQVYDPQKSKNYLLNNKTIGEETIEEVAAWQRKEGKNQSGGLNEKGRKSYERENPGSDLKAPSKKVGNPRRKSFCARMKGMKKKLTSSKTANDPNSRINKSLRAWNC